MDERMRRSRAQERKGAIAHGGRTTPASGAGAFRKGDVRTPETLIEFKRTDKTQMTLKAEWLEKIRREALIDGRIPVVGIQLGGRNWVLLLEDDFLDRMAN